MDQRLPYAIFLAVGFGLVLPYSAYPASFPPVEEESVTVHEGFVGSEFTPEDMSTDSYRKFYEEELKARAIAEKNINYYEKRLKTLKPHEEEKRAGLEQKLAAEKAKLAAVNQVPLASGDVELPNHSEPKSPQIGVVGSEVEDECLTGQCESLKKRIMGSGNVEQ